ncbi:MAG TPA: TldD/PmbA family protein [Candidatus Dormibacteraeota bacterium]|nr:TldD/PmbA family protein [Candidatus Dormibacteraeota bacterium]
MSVISGNIDTRVADLRSVTDEALRLAPAKEAEVIIFHRDTALTRFANSEIHQNVAERDLTVRIRVVDAGRFGVASTNSVDADSLRRAGELALEAARRQPVREMTPPLAPPAEADPPPIDPATAAATPEDRASLVAIICADAEARGVSAFGALSTGINTYAVANSGGLFLAGPRTIANLQVATIAGDGHGYADRASIHFADIDAAAAGEEAIDKALNTRDAGAIEPGVYPVVLEEAAVAELLEYLSYIGFSGLAAEEGRTFMRLGEKITGASIHVWDDGNDPSGLPMTFDFEGVPKRRVELITDGVATGLVHDMASAVRFGVESTGHGLPAPNPIGAWASNLFIGGGNAGSKADLLKGIERGVWVTRFWYVNVLHPRQSLLTGMTRDGTFLIEKGEITRPIKNMRFTQSVMEALAGASAITRKQKLVAGSDYEFTQALMVPAMRLDAFNFTSVTR